MCCKSTKDVKNVTDLIIRLNIHEYITLYINTSIEASIIIKNSIGPIIVRDYGSPELDSCTKTYVRFTKEIIYT